MNTLTLRSIQTESHPETKMTFWYLFATSKGAKTRIKIMRLLQSHPYNTHRISQELMMDYKAIKHHMDILEKNNLIDKFDANYGATFFPSTIFEENKVLFDEIISRMSV
ncbi:winged helix-turn-helix transcriptional regulator [Nitrosopumilus sp. K4]|uniref:winged helix-turn-helix domain-containing protein n=1 Tax=Nitrosopumilus sp. K4 TaxID=2795383 RepID=UPI001BA5616D|nr:winged helix-turn-helix domain-containing protein [Nitrosopumilus sp. K4]QUC64148.1 winged helix-turn-helix transcriptional regulator [Nitrosopumilus sp. K4]